MIQRFLIASALALLACDDRPAASPAYTTVRLEPFTPVTAASACPKGYVVLWKKECLENTRINAALLLCCEDGAEACDLSPGR
jgi:hypothetical protein